MWVSRKLDLLVLSKKVLIGKSECEFCVVSGTGTLTHQMLLDKKFCHLLHFLSGGCSLVCFILSFNMISEQLLKNNSKIQLENPSILYNDRLADKLPVT